MASGAAGSSFGLQATSKAAQDVVSKLQALVQTDECSRGIGNLVEAAGPGVLLQAARDLVSSRSGRVVVVTGFPCMQVGAVDEDGNSASGLSPQETDGPPGAAAIARASWKLGADVVLAVERPNAGVLQAAVKEAVELGSISSAQSTEQEVSVKKVQIAETLHLHVFPAQHFWNSGAEKALVELSEGLPGRPTNFISIERAGPSPDGTHRTMKGRVMEDTLLGPLERLFTHSPRAIDAHITTTGIGDGGNEVGMGSPLVFEQVKATVSQGEEIACVTPCDNILVCSVSNWGGYALAVASAVVAADAKIFPSVTESLNALVGPRSQAEKVLQATVHAGARDGITGADNSVDTLPFARNLDLLEELRAVAMEFTSLQIENPCTTL